MYCKGSSQFWRAYSFSESVISKYSSGILYWWINQDYLI